MARSLSVATTAVSSAMVAVVDILLSRLSPYIYEIIGDHRCGFDITDQLLIRFSAFVRYWRRMRQYISYS
jgi:hypothetical protein